MASFTGENRGNLRFARAQAEGRKILARRNRWTELGNAVVSEVPSAAFRELRVKNSGKVAIDFDGDDTADACGERNRQGPATGPNLQKYILGGGGERGEELGDPGRFKEVLAETLARARKNRHSSSSSGPSVSPRQ